MSKFKLIINRFSNDSSERFGFLKRTLHDIIFQKWIIVIVMSLTLTFILSPQLPLRPPKYMVGSIATKNIKADHEFLVEDPVSTEQRKIKALSNVQQVYDYDKGIPALIEKDLNDAFFAVGASSEKIYVDNEEEYRENIRSKFESAIGFKLSDREHNVLGKYNYSSNIYKETMKIVHALYDRGFISNEIMPETVRDTGIIIQDIDSQELREERDFSSIIHVKEIGNVLEAKMKKLPETLPGDASSLALSLSKKLVKPNLTFAKNATEQHKAEILRNIKPVFYKVQKNEMIVREGEKITQADLDKLNTLFRGYEGKWFLTGSAFSGMFLMVFILALIMYPIFSNLLPSLNNTNIDVLFLGLIAVMQIFLVRAGIFICESLNATFQLLPDFSCLYAIPFTVGSFLVSVLLNRNTGLAFAVFLSVLSSFLFKEMPEMLIYALMGNFMAVYYIAGCKQRSTFLKAGAIIGSINMASVLCISLLSATFFSPNTIFMLFAAFLGGLLSGIIASGIVPLFEYFFGYITDISLLEHANLNQPVFQQMIMVAPGTYHHSVVVASMAEAAAESIGANSLLAKVSAYYHDIGKIKKSIYYIENQQNWENKHDNLTPKMSSLVIISHVKDGIELAKQHKLGRAITEIIRQHHGTRKVNFFYEKAKKMSESTGHKLLESDFRYPGPKPQTKEAGIVLLADVVEATSRTLREPTPSRIRNLVEELIRVIMNEGELDESDLTFRDLSGIAESFTRILNGIFHHRIDYAESSTAATLAASANGEKKNGRSRKKQPGNGKS